MTPKALSTLAATAALRGLAVDISDGHGSLTRFTVRRGLITIRYLAVAGSPLLRIAPDTPEGRRVADQFERLYALST